MTSRRATTWVLANAGGAALAATAIVHAIDRSDYRDLVQEDGPVEWATVAAFVAAALAHGTQAWQLGRVRRRALVFPLVMVAFCVFVAGEEISWGQRILTYQPPAYFLEHNTQQEANLHNLFKEVLRTKYLLMVLLIGWGVLTPALAAARPRLAEGARNHLGLVAPPLAVAPTAVATTAVLIAYPWPYTGEVAELAFGLLVVAAATLASSDRGDPSRRRVTIAAGLVAASLVAGAAIPALASPITAGPDPRVDIAGEETRLLAEDWLAQLEEDGQLPSGCGTHVRLYTWMRSHDHARFRDGGYAGRADIDPARRRYFLDPWNNPYWIWHECDERRQWVLLYSFGPDRRRSSRRGRSRGDDIGTTVER